MKQKGRLANNSLITTHLWIILGAKGAEDFKQKAEHQMVIDQRL